MPGREKSALRSFLEASGTEVWWLGAAIFARGLCGFPLFRHQTEPDALLGALCGLHILNGDFLWLFPPGRFGAGECLAAAPVIAVLGATRLAAAVVAWLLGVAQIGLHFLLLREILGPVRTRGVLPLLALCPPAVLFWTGIPNHYAMTMMLSTAVLWWAARCSRRAGVAAHLSLGGIMGLAFWQSMLTLIVIAPALAFVSWQRRRSATLGMVAATAVGFALGALPWLIVNVGHDWAAVRGNYGARAATGFSMLVANAENLVTYRIPDLLAADRYQGRTAGGLAWLVHPMRPVVLLVYGVLAVAAVVRRDEIAREAGKLAWAVVVVAAGATVVSAAGEAAVFSERYVLPAWPALTLLVAVGLHALAAHRRLVAFALLLPICAYNLLAFAWPGTALRSQWRQEMLEEDAALATLKAHGTTAVVGSYWSVYAFNYLSGESVLGIPCQSRDDFLDYRRRAARSPQHWAVADRRGELPSWLGDVPSFGRASLRSPGWDLWFPKDPSSGPTATDLALERGGVRARGAPVVAMAVRATMTRDR